MTYTFVPLTKEESPYLENGVWLLYKYDDGSVAIGKLEIRETSHADLRHFFRHTQQPQPSRFKNIWEIGLWHQYSKLSDEDAMLWKLENA
jgi:hypothetical protein